MHNYSEKRGFQRMPMECPVRFRIQGDEKLSVAIVKDLSSSGLLILAEQAIPAGTQLALEILPGKSITPPLCAEAHVIRSDADEAGNFHIACGIDRIFDEHEAGPDFP
jgi:hypothetical protein